MARIPISDKQVIGFFKAIGNGFQAVVAKRLATRSARITAGSALLATFVLLGIVCRPQPSEVTVQGLVLAVEARDILLEETGPPHCRVLIAVGDTTETTLLLPPPVPDPGHFVPLDQVRDWRGRVGYELDEEKWLAIGPS